MGITSQDSRFKTQENNACLLWCEFHLCLFGKVCSVEMELFSLGIEALLVEISLRYSHVQMVHQSLKYTVGVYCVYRDGILGHHFSKSHESFAPCYSQSPSSSGFQRKPILSSGFKILTKNPRNKKNRV
jgi:hypothetical protein